MAGETNKAEYMGEKTLTEDGRKIVGESEVEAVNPSFATIMANHKPNPWGKGHLQLYALSAVCFLNSTMSGQYIFLFEYSSNSHQVLTAHSWAASMCSPTIPTTMASHRPELHRPGLYLPSFRLDKCALRSSFG
jgi:hypothetical protein